MQTAALRPADFNPLADTSEILNCNRKPEALGIRSNLFGDAMANVPSSLAFLPDNFVDPAIVFRRGGAL